MQPQFILESRFPVSAVDHRRSDFGREYCRKILLGQAADPSPVGRFFPYDAGEMRVNRPLEKRLGGKFRPLLKIPEKFAIITVYLPAYGIGNFGTEAFRLIPAPLEDQKSLILGPFFQDLQDISHIPLLFSHELFFRQKKVGDYLV